MLVKPTLESLLKKVDSRYTLSVVAAKRARQLVNGAQPLANSDTPNFVTTACEEIKAMRIIPMKGILDVYIPLRPEVAAERLAAKTALENARLQEAIEENITRNARSAAKEAAMNAKADEMMADDLEENFDIEDEAEDLGSEIILDDADQTEDEFEVNDDLELDIGEAEEAVTLDAVKSEVKPAKAKKPAKANYVNKSDKIEEFDETDEFVALTDEFEDSAKPEKKKKSAKKATPKKTEISSEESDADADKATFTES
jgi:DNA-directed RNA polymerase subunit omega